MGVKLQGVKLRLALGLAARVARHAQEVDVGDAGHLDRRLEREEEPRVRALLGLQGEEVLPLERRRAARHLVVGVADEHLGERRLAAAVLAHDRVDLALAHGQVDALEDLLAGRGDLGLEALDLEQHGPAW